MLIEAIYDHGRVRFLQPIRLRHEQFKLTIELPDAEVVTIAEPAKADLNSSALDLLLKDYPDDLWLQRMKTIEAEVLATPESKPTDLTPKQWQYSEAFALRGQD